MTQPACGLTGNVYKIVSIACDQGKSLAYVTEDVLLDEFQDYKPFITFAAAFTVFSMSASLCAVERKPASNCDGAK